MELNKILSDGRWGDMAALVNANFEKIKVELMKLRFSSILTFCKGYFSTEARLVAKYPKGKTGEYAFVGIPWPGTVWEWIDTKWVDSGVAPQLGDSVFMELLKRHIDNKTILWDDGGQYIYSLGGGGGSSFAITVSMDASSAGKCKVEATGDVVSVVPSSDGGSYVVAGTLGGTVKVKMIPDTGYEIAAVTVDNESKGAVSEYVFNKLSANHSMSVRVSVIDEVATDFLVRSDLPGSYYSSTQDALNAVKTDYPDGLTRDVTITCVKAATEKRKSDHYIAAISNFNQRSMFMLTIDGGSKLNLNGRALGCLSFANVDNIAIRNINFEDYSNYVGYQIPDAVGALSFTGNTSKYARNLFVGGCTFNGKSMTDEKIMSNNSLILIDTENVTVNDSSFVNGCGPVVNVDNCNLLSVLNNDFDMAPIGVGYPTAVTASTGRMLIMEDNRFSGDNRYSFASITNIDKVYIRRNTFRDGGCMALSLSSSTPMSKLVIESNLFTGMLSNTSSINTWAQAVIGLCPVVDMELNNNTFYMSGVGQQYCTRWGTITRLSIFNNVVVDAKHAEHFVYGFIFDNVMELASNYNVYQYKLHDNITYGSIIRIINTDGVEGAVEINADQACRFWKIQELGYDTHSLLVSDGVDADALDTSMMVTSVLDNGNSADNTHVPAIDLAYKSKSTSANSRGCYNRHGNAIDETVVNPGYTGYNMQDESAFSNAAQYSSMAEDILLLTAKTLDRNQMPVFSIVGSADKYLVVGRYGLLAPVPILDSTGEYLEDELYDINMR